MKIGNFSSNTSKIHFKDPEDYESGDKISKRSSKSYSAIETYDTPNIDGEKNRFLVQTSYPIFCNIVLKKIKT